MSDVNSANADAHLPLISDGTIPGDADLDSSRDGADRVAEEKNRDRDAGLSEDEVDREERHD
ncbi:hypothetical protein BH11ACT3_BH11ACT3_17810 [soil metagenome]